MARLRIGRFGSIRAWLAQQWVPVVLVIVGTAVSGAVTLTHSDALSPLDEWVYVDYLYKIPEQGIVLKGEEIGDQARDLMACEGVTPYGPMGPACDADHSDASEFPFGGITSADQYTPFYFYPTFAIGTAINVITGLDNVTSWRLTSPLWLAAGLVFFVLLLRRWEVPEPVTLALGLLIIGSPFSYWTFSYVSTDAPSFFFGAALLLAATKALRGSLAWRWFIALSALAMLFKITNVLAIGLAVLLILVEWIARRRDTLAPLIAPPSRAWLPPVAAVGALALATIAEAAWLIINRATAATIATAEQDVTISLTVEELLRQSTNFLPGTIASNVVIAGSADGALALDVPTFVYAPLSWICIAGVVAGFWSIVQRSERSSLVIAVAIGSVVAAPALALALQLLTGTYFPLPARYGAGILAGILLVAAIAIRNRWMTGIMILYGTGLCIVLPIASYLIGLRV